MLALTLTDGTEITVKRAQAAAASLGLQIEAFTASTNREIDAAFASLLQKQADALLVLPTAFFYDRRVQIVTLAAVPAAYFSFDFVDVGGLMSYGPIL